MTDDRNLKSGNHISKFCIHDNCDNEAIYNFWGMKPKYYIDHKKDYHANIYENPVSKFCNYDECKKTAIYNYWGMRPRYCFDHKDKYHINIPKKHILCYKHFISHSPKTKCPKCKVKKSLKCDECNIAASYNFPKLKPLKCLKHRQTGMVNIKRNHILCKKYDISHSRKTECKKCKTDLDKYDTSSKYMKDKIYKQYKKELIEKIKKKFKNHHYKIILQNILNNTKDEKTLKFKEIREERKKTKRKQKNKDTNEDNNNCKICGNNLNVNIDHFKTKEHIDNFNKNIEISTKKLIEEKFIDIIFKFKINTDDVFLKDLHFKKVAKQKVKKNMGKNKKYKYNITFYKGVLDNISYKLIDYDVSYNPEDIFKAIDTNYSDMNMLNTNKVNDKSNKEQTKIRQNELNKKEKEKLDNIESLSEQDKDKLYEENKKFLETIKKIEHTEIKEWLIEQGYKEDEITEK